MLHILWAEVLRTHAGFCRNGNTLGKSRQRPRGSENPLRTEDIKAWKYVSGSNNGRRLTVFYILVPSY